MQSQAENDIEKERRKQERRDINEEEKANALDPIQNILKAQRTASRTISILTLSLIAMAGLFAWSLNTQNQQARTVKAVQDNQTRGQCIRQKQADAFKAQADAQIAQAQFLFNFAGIFDLQIDQRSDVIKQIQTDALAAKQSFVDYRNGADEYRAAGKTCDDELKGKK